MRRNRYVLSAALDLPTMRHVCAMPLEIYAMVCCGKNRHYFLQHEIVHFVISPVTWNLMNAYCFQWTSTAVCEFDHSNGNACRGHMMLEKEGGLSMDKKPHYLGYAPWNFGNSWVPDQAWFVLPLNAWIKPQQSSNVYTAHEHYLQQVECWKNITNNRKMDADHRKQVARPTWWWANSMCRSINTVQFVQICAAHTWCLHSDSGHVPEFSPAIRIVRDECPRMPLEDLERIVGL
jgi:hypothetical protein